MEKACIIARGAGYLLWISTGDGKPLFNITKGDSGAPPHCAYALEAILIIKGLEVVDGILRKNPNPSGARPRRELPEITIPRDSK